MSIPPHQPQQPGGWPGAGPYGPPPYGQPPAGPPQGGPPAGQPASPTAGTATWGAPDGGDGGGNAGRPAPGWSDPKRLLRGGLVALAVIAAVVVALVFTVGGDANASPRSVAEKFVAATNTQDRDAARDLLCTELRNRFSHDEGALVLGETTPFGPITTTLGEVRDTGEGRAEADVRLGGTGIPPGFGYTLEIVEEGGGWYVCGFGFSFDLPGGR